MITLRWLLPVFLPLAAALLLAASAASAATTFRLGHVTATTHPFHDGAVRFADAVAKATNGAVKVNIFPSRQLGDDIALLQQVQMGGVDCGVISQAVFTTSVPALNALQLPFLIPSYQAAARVYPSEAAVKLLEKLAPLNMRGLGIYEGGFRHFLSTKGMVQSPADMKGLKTRVGQSPLQIDIFRALGASPTPMAYGEVYTALQTKTIDAVEINVSSIYGEKFYEVGKFFTLTGHYMWPGLLVINKAKLEGLPADQQRAIVEAAKASVEPQVLKAAQDEITQLAEIKKHGVQVAPVANIRPFKDSTKGVYDKYEGIDPAVKNFVGAVQAMGLK